MPHVTEDRESTAAQPTSSPVLAGLWQFVIVVGIFAVVAVVAGVVWEWLWTPAVGTAEQHTWQPTIETVTAEFSSTAWYVVVASVAGLITAAVVGLAFKQGEVVTLVAVVVGSALAAWVMLEVGYSLDPGDPQAAAASAADGTPIPAELMVPGKSPFLAFPASALLALVIVFFGVVRRHRSDG
jgi:uncharacterized membrane protein YeaQ/YmgE (transglycosylase-associated protein family)